MSKAEAFLGHFMAHRSVLSKLVDELKDKDLTYRPWDDGFSTGDLIWHILSSSYGFTRAAATGSFERLTEKPAFETTADVKQAIANITEKVTSFIQSMRDEQFSAEIDMTRVFNRTVPAEQLLSMMLDHEIHHKGQLFTYVRLCGAKQLPMFFNPSGK